MAAKTGRGLAEGTSAAQAFAPTYVDLTVNYILVTGIEAAAEETSDVTYGNQFVNGTGKKVFVQARNDNVAEKDLTILIPGEVDTGIPNSDRVISIPAGDTYLIGPFPSHIYNWEGTTLVRVLAEHADVKLVVYQLA